MAKDKNYMPQSGAGLMRFNEDMREAVFKLKPEHVVVLSVGIGVFLVIARFVL